MTDISITPKKSKRNDLTAEYLRSILDYNPDTGEFRWKNRLDIPPESNKRWKGKKAGRICSAHGYLLIGINFKSYRAHRLAWLYITDNWPIDCIDHKNLMRLDNRFCNLREATHSQNQQNHPKRKSNTSGYKGVGLTKGKYWRARIFLSKKEIVLGYFKNKEDARIAYEKAAKEYYGEFARLK